MRHIGWVVVVVAACGGNKTTGTIAVPPAPMGKMDSMMMEGGKMSGDEASVYGALDVGVDWQSYTRLNKVAFESQTHGGRMVDVYVNAIGIDAYRSSSPMPVGSIVVKPSHQADGTEGPVFVMEKRAAGFNSEHGDWYFAIHWADPPGEWKQKVGGGPIYWRTPSPKVSYCADCHDAYDDHDSLGGVPEAERAW
jgi:hypothetical protein